MTKQMYKEVTGAFPIYPWQKAWPVGVAKWRLPSACRWAWSCQTTGTCRQRGSPGPQTEPGLHPLPCTLLSWLLFLFSLDCTCGVSAWTSASCDHPHCLHFTLVLHLKTKPKLHLNSHTVTGNNRKLHLAVAVGRWMFNPVYLWLHSVFLSFLLICFVNTEVSVLFVCSKSNKVHFMRIAQYHKSQIASRGFRLNNTNVLSLMSPQISVEYIVTMGIHVNTIVGM